MDSEFINIIQRVLAGYAGTLLGVAVLVPWAIYDSMGGHSMAIIVGIGGPIGLLIGLVLYDITNGLIRASIQKKFLISLLTLVVSVVLLEKLGSIGSIFIPMIVSIAGGLFCTKRIEKEER